jgi:hypothetical protein
MAGGMAFVTLSSQTPLPIIPAFPNFFPNFLGPWFNALCWEPNKKPLDAIKKRRTERALRGLAMENGKERPNLNPSINTPFPLSFSLKSE